MKTIANGFIKFIVLNLAVVFVLMIMPVFLITDNVAMLDQIVEYLLKTKK